MLFLSPITRVPAFRRITTQKQVIPQIDGVRFVVSSSSHFRLRGNRKWKRPQYKAPSTPARLPESVIAEFLKAHYG
jgi:hypothetical protein